MRRAEAVSFDDLALGDAELKLRDAARRFVKTTRQIVAEVSSQPVLVEPVGSYHNQGVPLGN
jgi:hypothetical protein